MPVSYLKGLAEYWRDGYDWRVYERKLNSYPQFTTEIDGRTSTSCTCAHPSRTRCH